MRHNRNTPGLGSPAASGAASCSDSDLRGFNDFIQHVHPADPIYDTITIARGDLNDPLVIAASEAMSNLPPGSITYNAAPATGEKVLGLPFFLYGRFNSGSLVPVRGLDDTNIYGGTFGSIHHAEGQHGVVQTTDRGGWRSSFLAAAMAIDTYSSDDSQPLATDLPEIQRAIILNHFLAGNRISADSPTFTGYAADFPGIFRNHLGDSDGNASITNQGSGALAHRSGLRPNLLAHHALIDLHDDSVKAPATRAWLGMDITFFNKVAGSPAAPNALFVPEGFNFVEDGTGGVVPVAAANQPGIKIRMELYPLLSANEGSGIPETLRQIFQL